MSHPRHQNNLQSPLRVIFTVAWGEEGCWLLEIFDISEFHDHKDTRAGPGLLGEIQSQVAKDVTVSGTLYSVLSILHSLQKKRN